MNVKEVLAAYDALLNREAFPAAKACLLEGIDAAGAAGDNGALLTLYNELMGFERQYGSAAASVEAAETALSLLKTLDLAFSYPAAMVWLNAATVLKNAGQNTRAGDCYRQAARCFERFYPAGDKAFAGLYNNMAAWLADTGEGAKAEYYYRRAEEILRRHGDVCDLAVTWFNLALFYARQDPCDPQIDACVQTGLEILGGSAAARDGYYYYTCRKCAGAAAQLGYFAAEQTLTERADKFYAGH